MRRDYAVSLSLTTIDAELLQVMKTEREKAGDYAPYVSAAKIAASDLAPEDSTSFSSGSDETSNETSAMQTQIANRIKLAEMRQRKYLMQQRKYESSDSLGVPPCPPTMGSVFGDDLLQSQESAPRAPPCPPLVLSAPKYSNLDLS